MQKVIFYVDDSGVFHHTGDRYTIFAGYVFYKESDKEDAERIFHTIESEIKEYLNIPENEEMKSNSIEPKYRRSLYSALNNYHRFSCVIDNSKIDANIWSHKKHKQRFLDYALKRQIKETIKVGFNKNLICRNKLTNVVIYFDEHTTATSGNYELQEGILEELVHGTFNYRYSHFFEPVLKKGSSVVLNYSDSKSVTLIRAADNVANRVYFEMNRRKQEFYEFQNDLKHHCSKKFP